MVKRPARARGRRLSLQLVWFGSAYRWCWVVRTAGWVERLSGGKEGFDGFVSEDDQRGHRPEAGRERLEAAGVADAATISRNAHRTFDSRREYLEQIDRFKRHQGKPTERRWTPSMKPGAIRMRQRRAKLRGESGNG